MILKSLELIIKQKEGQRQELERKLDLLTNKNPVGVVISLSADLSVDYQTYLAKLGIYILQRELEYYKVSYEQEQSNAG